MFNTKKAYELGDIVDDKLQLMYLFQMADTRGLMCHIQNIERKNFVFMTYFLLLHPKPFFISDQANWCAHFLDLLYAFKMCVGENL